MIIAKTDNHYIVKLINNNINIYDQKELEEITKKIIFKTNKKYKLKSYIHLEFYTNKNYGILIKLTDYNSPFLNKKEKTVKITINTEHKFLYQIDYLNINKDIFTKDKIYYYKNNFYLEINSEIRAKDYLTIVEQAEIIYDDIDVILNKGIKM